MNGSQFSFEMSDSQIANGSSIDFGGCLDFFISQYSNQNTDIKIYNSTFKKCKSQYLGGAISGIRDIITLENVNFIECSSQIGGAIYSIPIIKFTLSDKYFSQNKGYLAANNYNQKKIQLNMLDILEFNQNSNNDTDLFQKTDEYLYPGLTYILRLYITVDGEDYYTFTNQNNFGNLYKYIFKPSNNFISNTPQQLLSINFPFLLWYAQDISFNGKQTAQFESFSIQFVSSFYLDTNQYKIYNGCKEQGMEKIYLNNQKNLQFICKYCQQMKVSYHGVCQNCPTDYFLNCYGNYSELKQFYWRSFYSVNPDDIFYCSNNPQSCSGGSGIGNQLCYEGHIGPQCLDCDINGSYWGERYSMVGFFQCSCLYLIINIQKTKK
ncbi:dual specificity phosphatase domain protein (macronuclear) [Tetrahymena thermophila SB210]|uniref:Dual specificity phosphatase domain protein n=1 Tax=Tetrahymena thermophila (strain SB210) TaxID=312017 RepID=Q22TW2_TETTS|nr:dual specificity phosphatase domain protein [Tetrahymena thermophila SB210]EAR88713.2 dual specificity phosphatase domain protein [Tetrahymena thermophila SB210]|eukprot:XP_001008958.2 dual specificity phosphatase domain protein [Tetrahymena thermophila SB210]